MDFLINLSRLANRTGDFLAQERGVLLAQTVDKRLDRPHTNLERTRRLFVRKCALVVRV